jgi:hypothetical protein
MSQAGAATRPQTFMVKQRISRIKMEEIVSTSMVQEPTEVDQSIPEQKLQVTQTIDHEGKVRPVFAFSKI